MSKNWQIDYQQARLEEILEDGTVICHLSPRNCKIKKGKQGFCGVRGNRSGRLITLNYGKGVHATEEVIETEAINHYSPGERILSMGNIGCMFNCDYCQNWKTSQVKYLEDRDVHSYTPEQVVDIAVRHGIRCLSWTYNDPVVWHEFILDTARLAKQAGLINLYKSAFYITPEAIDELLPYIDIFSISLKAVDEGYYRKITKGRLQPVLNGIKQVYDNGKHLELSTLMITDISDNEETAMKIADWMMENLDSTVPLHFVRFHPDYKMQDTIRTPVERLIRAREVARERGIEHVYLGNVVKTPFTNTFCRNCGAKLVDRFGLNAKIINLDENGCCTSCGHNAHFKFLPSNKPVPTTNSPELNDYNVRTFNWHGDIVSVHIQVKNNAEQKTKIYHRRRNQNGNDDLWTVIFLIPGESFRLILSKSSNEEIGLEIAMPQGLPNNLHEVFDRAHFPTVSIEEGMAQNDQTPLPIFAK
jgi:pyruvate formate lyase activating enzyme